MEAPAVRAAYYAMFHQGNHVQQVQRLYRYGLKNILNYAVQRDVFHEEIVVQSASYACDLQRKAVTFSPRMLTVQSLVTTGGKAACGVREE
eukprot:2703033-Pyramimonas_sp.AAC.3